MKASETLPVAFRAIIKNKILALPVFRDDAATEQAGFIDILDILYYVLSVRVGSLNFHKCSTYCAQLEETAEREHYDEVLKLEEFQLKKCADVVNFSGRNTILKLSNEANMWTALNAMLDFGDLHRLATEQLLLYF